MYAKYLLPAALALAAIAASLCLATGGCGGKRLQGAAPPSPADERGAIYSTAVDAPERKGGKPVVGCGTGLIARLEELRTVKATLFHADGRLIGVEEVDMLPGTWLVPGPAITIPGSGDD